MSRIASPPLSRRSALRRLSGATVLARAAVPDARAAESAPSLPPTELLRSDPESFWLRLRREQFLLAEDRVFLNPGSLGVMPRPVLQAATDSLRRSAEYATDDVQRWGYETLEAERAAMSDFLGCRKEELAFTHNCTEAMNHVAHGLDLRPGDEVIITNQEHPGGSTCWRARAARTGIVVREIEIPVSPRDPDELHDRLVAAFGPRTRVLSFSGVTSATGLVLPAQRLCRTARERGIVSVVDGAHMDGQIPVHLHDLGCDYFAGSPHKWMFAPAGCGLLYGRDDALERIWPVVTGSGWDNHRELRAARFMMIGTNNRATIDGMMAGLGFLQALGEPAIHARMRQLADLALAEVRRRDYLEAVTPADPRLHQAMVSFRFKTEPPARLWELLRQRRVNVLGGQRVRLSLHVHARPADLALFFRTCDEIVTG